MTYSVILVEDEPGASAYLQTLIDRNFPKLRIIACADDGVAGLELAEQLNPDLMLIDIHMPNMDGLELIKCLHAKMPQVSTVIISGYQDFEYARTAMRYGAIDYLLKPVSLEMIAVAMRRIIPKVSNQIYAKRKLCIQAMIQGKTPDLGDLKKLFPEPYYRTTLTRKNGLPRRFAQQTASEILSFDEDTMFLYGRDECESLCICEYEAMSFNELITFTQDIYLNSDGFITAIHWDGKYTAEEMPVVLHQLYRTLNTRLTLGHSQQIFINKTHHNPEFPQPTYPNEVIQKIQFAIGEYDKKGIRHGLKQLLYYFDQECLPQLLAEQIIRKVLASIQHGNISKLIDSEEFVLEDVFFYATSYSDLEESLLELLEQRIFSPTSFAKMDTPEFFEEIKQYIQANLEQKQLSISHLCKVFNLSQSYLSRLFRKYVEQSFNNYLTELRIDKSKYLMKDGTIKIKDVAELVGIANPFYFSTLFRSITGLSPTEYVHQQNCDVQNKQ